MGGQNSLKITYGKSRLLERKKRKRKKKKEHLWKVIYKKKYSFNLNFCNSKKKKKKKMAD